MDRRLIDALMEAVVPVIREREAVLVARIEALEARPAPERGEKGDKGDAGDKGDQGDRGEPGPVGLPGIQGEKGIDGKDGSPGERGEPGDKGERGADAPAVTKEQIVDAVLAARDMVEGAVMKYIAANPPKDGINGKDGEPGEKGDKGDKGDPGEPARDGRDGLPGVPGGKGADGINGKDGLSPDDFVVSLGDDGRTLSFALKRGDEAFGNDIVLPIPLDRGVWKDLTDYVRGDGVTHDGSFWIAQRETQTRPGMPGSDWRLAVKKGQNGKDLRPDEQRAAAPVRFK